MVSKKLPLRYATSSDRVIPTSLRVSPTDGELYTDRKLKGSRGCCVGDDPRVWRNIHSCYIQLNPTSIPCSAREKHVLENDGPEEMIRSKLRL